MRLLAAAFMVRGLLRAARREPPRREERQGIAKRAKAYGQPRRTSRKKYSRQPLTGPCVGGRTRPLRFLRVLGAFAVLPFVRLSRVKD